MAINEFENALQFCDLKKNETWPVDLDSAIENLWQTKCDLILSKLRLLNSVAGLLISNSLDLKCEKIMGNNQHCISVEYSELLRLQWLNVFEVN